MTSVGGAVGGYLARAKREQDLLAGAQEYKMIEGVEVVDDASESGFHDAVNDTGDTTAAQTEQVITAADHETGKADSMDKETDVDSTAANVKK